MSRALVLKARMLCSYAFESSLVRLAFSYMWDPYTESINILCKAEYPLQAWSIHTVATYLTNCEHGE